MYMHVYGYGSAWVGQGEGLRRVIENAAEGAARRGVVGNRAGDQRHEAFVIGLGQCLYQSESGLRNNCVDAAAIIGAGVSHDKSLGFKSCDKSGCRALVESDLRGQFSDPQLTIWGLTE